MQCVTGSKEHIRGDLESSLLAELHLDDTLVPACVKSQLVVR